MTWIKWRSAMRLSGLLFVVALASCCTAPRIKMTEQDRVIDVKHGGHTRIAIVHRPVNSEITVRVPLLIALHGGGGTAEGMIKLTRSRFNELADRHGFLVVYPQGLKKSWNDDRADPISYAHKNNIDDIGYLSKLIQIMRRDHNVDSGRVFVTGISNGGFMCFRVARELSGQVKAVAPVCATIPQDSKENHIHAPPVSIVLINGTMDPLVPYDGGHVQVLNRNRGNIISTDETIRIFIGTNACSGVPRIDTLANIDPDDKTMTIRNTYVNPKTGQKVVLVRIEGGGHTWPGGWQYLNRRMIGRTSRDFNAADEIWSFFNSLP